MVKKILAWLKRAYVLLVLKSCSKIELRTYLETRRATASFDEEKFLIEAILEGMSGTIDSNSRKGKRQIAVLDIINDIMQKKGLIEKNSTFLNDDYA